MNRDSLKKPVVSLPCDSTVKTYLSAERLAISFDGRNLLLVGEGGNVLTRASLSSPASRRNLVSSLMLA